MPTDAYYDPELCTLSGKPYSGTTARQFMTFEQRAALARETMRPAPELEMPSLETTLAAAELIYQTWYLGRT